MYQNSMKIKNMAFDVVFFVFCGQWSTDHNIDGKRAKASGYLTVSRK